MDQPMTRTTMVLYRDDDTVASDVLVSLLLLPLLGADGDCSWNVGDSVSMRKSSMVGDMVGRAVVPTVKVGDVVGVRVGESVAASPSICNRKAV